MIDMQNQEEIPILEDFAAYIRNFVPRLKRSTGAMKK